MESVLSSDLILLKILSKLSIPDLLKASLVSKKWTVLSRTVLRDQRRCTVHFLGRDICCQLLRFHASIRTMESVPYNSLQVNPCHLNGSCTDVSAEETAQMCTTILTKMKLKYLKVDWFKELGLPDHNCPIVVTFLKQIFKNGHCSDLECLDFSHLPELQMFTTCFDIHPENELGSLLPNLKTFKMVNCRRSLLDFLKEIHRAAPNIQNLICNVKSSMLDYFFSHGNYRTIKKLVLNPVKNEGKICFRFSKTKPELRYFTFSSIADRDYGASSYFFNTVKSILESSQDSLEHLYADQLDMVWLARQDVCFPRLSHLSTRFGLEVTEELGFNSLEKIDFQRLFPNLRSVQISPEYCRPGVSLGDYVSEEIRKREFTSCETVSELKLKYAWQFKKEGGMEIIARVFPNVTHFIFEEMETYFVECMEELHKCWPGLERITLSGYKVWKHCRAFSTVKSDAAFIGISEAEAEDLRKFDVDALKGLNIKPKKFSFREFKSLKKLQIDTNHSYRECRINDDNKFLFSELTGHLVFSKMPNLSVEIGRVVCNPQDGVSCCGYKLKELAPCVRFVSRTVEHSQEHHNTMHT